MTAEVDVKEGREVGCDVLDALGAPRRGNECERVTVIVPPGLDGVEVWRAENSLRYWKVFHSTYSFCAVDPRWRGSASWRCRREEFEMLPRGHQLFEPGDVHHTFKVGGPPANFHVVMVSAPTVHAWLGPEAPGSPSLPRGALSDPDLWHLFQRLCHALRRDGSRLNREALLAAYLRRVFDRAGGTQPRPVAVCDARVRRVTEIIQARFSEDLSLTELADQVNLSPCHLARTFSAAMPLPIHKYLTTVRLARARDLMKRGRRPSEVLTATGFSDLVTLNRAFRRYLGFTAGHYGRAWAPRRAPRSEM